MRSKWLFIISGSIVVMAFVQGLVGSYLEARNNETAFRILHPPDPLDTVWRGCNKYGIPLGTDSGDLIWYGRELITNTSTYLGPKGTVAHISNGMDCQNCHMDGGTVPFGNNFGKVYATYPQFRARGNGMQTIYMRINDCLLRSLNGGPMDSGTHEMKAMYAYLKWLDKDVPKGVVHLGTGIPKLKYLDRAANPLAGMEVYIENCQRCHGRDGEGESNIYGNGYSYPPLWGKNSYNDGAGLYRLGSFAGFVKYNMPLGTDYHGPKLSDGEVWDVAAFVNSQPRPHMDQRNDWHDIAKKPVDFPFGLYNDTFSEHQHKYGPYPPIEDFNKTKK